MNPSRQRTTNKKHQSYQDLKSTNNSVPNHLPNHPFLPKSCAIHLDIFFKHSLNFIKPFHNLLTLNPLFPLCQMNYPHTHLSRYPTRKGYQMTVNVWYGVFRFSPSCFLTSQSSRQIHSVSSSQTFHVGVHFDSYNIFFEIEKSCI